MKELGRTEGSLRSRVRRLKLTSDIRLWTEENDRYLKENYGKRPIGELMKELGRSKYAVESRANKILKIGTKKVSFWSEEDKKFLRENINKISQEEIAKKLGRTVSSVKSLAWKQGFLRPDRHPVLPNEENEERPPVLPNDENEGKNVPVNGSETLFLNWVEKNNISEFELNDFVNAYSQITRGLAEKIITQQIHRGYVNQMGKNMFLVSGSKLRKPKQ